MNIKQIKAVVLSFAALAALASCNKVNDVTEQYLRGGNSLAITTDGNLIVAGYNTSSNKGYQATLIKVNATNGDTLWMKGYGGAYADAFYSVNVSHEGGFVATGFSNKVSTGSPAMNLVITNDSGRLLNSYLYGSSYYSQGFCVLPLQGANDGYLLSGYLQTSTNADRDIYLVKTKNTGELLWAKTIGAKSDPYDTVNDAAYAVIAAPNGGYFITGSLNGGISSGGKIFLMKVSAEGDSLWTRTFGTGIGYSLTLTHDAAGLPDGGIAIGGTLQDGDNKDIVIIKTDTSKTGSVIWKYQNAGTGFEYGATMVETSPDRGLAINGITNSSGAGSEDVYLVKIAKSGTFEWADTYGGSNIDDGFGLVQMNDGDFCITGLSNSGGSFIFLNRVTDSGAQVWPMPKYIQ
jgi:hypothetical protein